MLAARSLSVSYPPVRALDRVDLDLAAGEVHALMGENGAGKSTLVRVLSGLVRPDGGQMAVAGRAFAPRSAREAELAGVSTVHQEIDLVPTLSVEENLLVGRYPSRLGFIRRGQARRRAEAALARVGVGTVARRRGAPGIARSVALGTAVGELPIGLRQMVAIARALDTNARVLVLDEPTSSLDAAEVRVLFKVLGELRSRGMAIVFVSHFLDQVYGLADRITVLRNGARVGTWATGDLDRRALVEAMTGRALQTQRTRGDGPAGAGGPTTARGERGTGATALSFVGLRRRGGIAATSGHVGRGEALGVAGLLGSGRTELARLLFGADARDGGEVRAGGTPLAAGSVRDAIARGVAFAPEDRRSQGLVLGLSVRENIVLALQARRGVLRPLARREQRRLADHYIRSLNIRTPSPEAPVATLSGGNQQKVLLARWLSLQPRVFILDEPTRGVDVGARAEIEALIRDLRDGGMAVVLVSSELDELVRTCGRVMVMRDRACAGELAGEDVTEGNILAMIAAGSPAGARA